MTRGERESIQRQLLGNLYAQVDGFALGSPIGQLMTNAFLWNIEENLKNQNKLPAFYKRYVDGTPSKKHARCFMCLWIFVNTEWNTPLTNFTMEPEDKGKLPFLGMVIIRNDPQLDMRRYESLRESNRYWASATQPKPCWRKV